jgi:hypothetical protein
MQNALAHISRYEDFFLLLSILIQASEYFFGFQKPTTIFSILQKTCCRSGRTSIQFFLIFILHLFQRLALSSHSSNIAREHTHNPWWSASTKSSYFVHEFIRHMRSMVIKGVGGLVSHWASLSNRYSSLIFQLQLLLRREEKHERGRRSGKRKQQMGVHSTSGLLAIPIDQKYRTRDSRVHANIQSSAVPARLGRCQDCPTVSSTSSMSFSSYGTRIKQIYIFCRIDGDRLQRPRAIYVRRHFISTCWSERVGTIFSMETIDH